MVHRTCKLLHTVCSSSLWQILVLFRMDDIVERVLIVALERQIEDEVEDLEVMFEALEQIDDHIVGLLEDGKYG